MRNRALIKAAMITIVVVIISLLLGTFTTFEYVRMLGGYDQLDNGRQIKRHLDILQGYACNPWQYRVLAPCLIDMVFELFERFNIHYHVAICFIWFRIIQDVLILLLAFIYYRKLGLNLPGSVIGMALLGWGMSNSYYNSDLSFNLFFDIIFYLLAGLCILERKIIWIIPITFFASLNRETCGLIPFLLLPIAIFTPKSKAISIFITAAAVYAVIFVGLRLFYGSREFLIPPGLYLLKDNLFRIITWQRLLMTLNIIPIIAMIGYRKWPHELQMFFWVIVPAWFIIHAFGAIMEETRLFLVPQAMVFIPGALLLIKSNPCTIRQNNTS